jgi:hypothetical protein
MKDWRLVWLAAAVLVLVTLACGGEEATAPETPPTSEAPPTMIPTNTPKPEPPTEVPEGASIEITNDSGQDVWYVYLSPSKADDWGDDRLGDVVIPAGDKHTISGIPEGIYDVLAANENGDEIEVYWGVELEGEITWHITGLASLQVTNESEDTIGYLYISPSESDSWGTDWLGDDAIAVGETYTVEGIPLDTYDIRVEDMNEDLVEAIYNVTLEGMDSWTVVGKTYLPSNAVLRFEDDFTDNRNNWGSDTEGEDAYYMRPADGEYCILIKASDHAGVEWYEPFTTDEFVAEVSCSITGADDATCGLGFGPDVDNIYWFEVSPNEQGFALFLRENGEWQDNLVDWTVSRSIDPIRANYLRLERVSGVVSLYINSVLVSQADGSRFPTGRVGIGGSTYDTPNATVCLDNLRVWRLE